MALIPEQTAIGDGQFLHRLVRALCERRDLGLIAHAVGWESALPTVLQPQDEVSSPEATCSLRQFVLALVREWERWHHPDGETIDRRSGYQKRGRAGEEGREEDEPQLRPDPIEHKSVQSFHEVFPRIGAPYRGLGTSDEEGPRAGYRAWCAAAAAMISDMRYFVPGVTASYLRDIDLGYDADGNHRGRLASVRLIKTGPRIEQERGEGAEHSVALLVACPDGDDFSLPPSFVGSAAVVASELIDETSTDEPSTEDFEPWTLPAAAWDLGPRFDPARGAAANIMVYRAEYENHVDYNVNWRWASVVDSDGTTATVRASGTFSTGEFYRATYIGERWLYNPCTIPCDVYARLTQDDYFEDPDPAPVQIGGVKNAPSDDDLNPAGATWKKIGVCEARAALRVLPALSEPPDVMSFLKGKCEDPPAIGEFAIDEQTGSRVIGDRPGRKSISYVSLSMTFMLDYGPYFQHFPASGDPLPQPDEEKPEE